MSDYLPKPIEPGQIAEILPKWLPQSPRSEPNGFSFDLLRPLPKDVFNESELLSRLSDDKSLAKQIIAGLLTDVPEQFRKLKRQIEEGDGARVSAQAHALKGAFATVSAAALRDLSSEIQQAATIGNLSRAASMLTQLDEQFEQFKRSLTQSGWI